MSIAWTDVAAALGLLLVIEGILPFLFPSGARDAFRRLASTDDATLRTAGAVSMVAGVAIVWLARS
jgi:uncharacterized protein YjeT (DUF2065 family)